MHTLQSTNYTIEIGSIINSTFLQMLINEYKKATKIIIVDENTKEYCLEYLITSFTDLSTAEVIELPAGEENKQIEICLQVWESLTEYHIDRNALIINLGGGVVTDMGGFIASLYKRGIHFINIPTTLLAMIDASVGGKTGVDMGVYKNQIGVFSFPIKVYIDSIFLSTLQPLDIKNGIVEMLKHGLIFNKEHWSNLKSMMKNKESITESLILESVKIKNQIVLEDPFEKDARKKLNFGHTIGHAVESYFLKINQPILHGLAVAVGIVVESFISFKLNFLTELEFEDIRSFIYTYFPKIKIDNNAIQEITDFTKQDKKNSNNQVKMVLLEKIGKAVSDITVTEDMIKSGLNDYIRFRDSSLSEV